MTNTDTIIKENDHIFVKSDKPVVTKWQVKPLIPAGDKGLIIAQPGVGKTFFTDGIATSTAYNKPFMGCDVVGGEVLIVDQDTPRDKAEDRLTKFENRFKCERQYNIYLHPQEGYYMDNGSLAALINSYPNLSLVILDTLAKIFSAKADLDKSKDVSGILTNFYSAIENKKLNILTNHHITTKHYISPIDLMTHPNPQSLAMNSTQIVAASDTLYVLASPDVDGTLTNLLIRPYSRRVTIPLRPFNSSLVETDSEAYFEPYKLLDISKYLSASSERVKNLCPLGENITFKEINSEHYFGENNLREKILPELERKGYFIYKGRNGKGGAISWTRIL